MVALVIIVVYLVLVMLAGYLMQDKETGELPPVLTMLGSPIFLVGAIIFLSLAALCRGTRWDFVHPSFWEEEKKTT